MPCPYRIRRNMKKKSFFNEYLGGDVFSKFSVGRQLPFVLYVAFLVMLYISNTYWAEDMRLDYKNKSKLLENRRVESVSLQAEITRLSRQSELNKVLKHKGIKESVVPVKRIIINKEKAE